MIVKKCPICNNNMTKNIATNTYFCSFCRSNTPTYSTKRTQNKSQKGCGCGGKKRRFLN